VSGRRSSPASSPSQSTRSSTLTALEQREDAVVIQVVYDGPPEAGKTTSVRALARSFGREVYTPEEEHGRTVFFDWLEHTGGRFDGAPIRCQIASVPGQERWLSRRLYFIGRADAVVFVGDTTAAKWAETRERLRDLRSRLEARDGPPVGVVFQANRRDAPDAVPIEVVRDEAASNRIAVVESVAIDGSGVRETFVLAVRLALDRIRESRVMSGAAYGGATAVQGEDIYSFLQSLETPVLPDESSSVGARAREPCPPSQTVPSGWVWPPVEGRIILREATLGGTKVERTFDGDWASELPGGFRLHSYSQAAFEDLERGRTALIDWARLHSSAQSLLSGPRCVALAETGDGGYRLWQVLRREPSLRDLFLDESSAMDAASAARLLAIASRLLTQAKAVCAVGAFPLPCNLDTVGVSELNRCSYVGLVPHAPFPDPGAGTVEAVASELASLLRDRPANERAHVRAAVQATHPTAFGSSGGARILELLSDLLAS
jgi:signal recognition particle receptor subunit beta